MSKNISVSFNKRIKKFNKTIKIPGDKSCSIRALLLASQCMGISEIKNYDAIFLNGENTTLKKQVTAGS